MPLSDSDWVIDLFAAGVRDWTPAAVRHAAWVIYAPVARDVQASRHCGAVLTDAEVRRAERFVTHDGKAHFLQRRAFRRYCGAVALGVARPLSEIAFRETDKGRPYLPERPDLWFSFSACRHGFVGAWSGTHAIGVDIEDRARPLEAVELAREYFADAEVKAVEGAEVSARLPMFLKLWCLKEAALKSIGEGLPFGLDAFAFALAPSLRIVHAPRAHGGPARFAAHVVETPGSCAAVVLHENQLNARGSDCVSIGREAVTKG